MTEPTTPVEPSEPEAEPPTAEGNDPSTPETRAEAIPPGGEADPTPAKEPRPEKPKRSRPRDPAIMRAYRTGLPVEGTIDKVIKGGYEVKIGKSQGFCPHSQIDLHRVDIPEEMLGKSFPFRVIQVRRGGDDVVLSRRALLEEQRVEEAKAVRAALLEGAVLDGRVARLADFGAFVDLGAGVTGLVHVTEMSHGRVNSPSDVVAPGDRVSVKILKIDDASGKISLSIRHATADPWDAAAERLKPGTVLEGTVVRLADFGAFVEVAEGVEVLAPARECPPVPGGWREALAPGTKRSFVVLASEPEKRRATVLPWLGEGVGVDPSEVVAGATLTGKVQKSEGFGVFVWLAPGKVGLVPRSWTGMPQGARLDTKFHPGDDLRVEVLDVAEDGHRIRLGIEGVPRPDEGGAEPRGRRGEREPRRADVPPPAEDQGTFGTNLGDALRAAMKKN